MKIIKNIKVLGLIMILFGCLFFVANSQVMAADEVTISFWAAWGEDSGPGAWIEEFEKEYPNINVEYVKFKNDDEGNVKIDVALAAGTEVDVFFNYGVKRIVPRWDLCQDLTKFTERDNFDVKEEIAGKHFTIDGEYHGLPIGAINNAVYINKDALDKAGLEVPTEWTLEEYKEYASKLTKGEGIKKVYGSSDFHDSRYWTMPVRGYLGSNAWYNDEGLSNFDHPAYKSALEFKYNMENVEKIQFPYSEMIATNLTGFTVMLQRRSNMAISANAIVRFLNNTEDYPRDFYVTVAPMPKLKDDQEINYNKGLNIFDYLAMGANISEEKKEAAWKFMKWLATEGNINLGSVGHIPTWTGVDKEQVIDYMLGNVKDTVDIEAFKRVVLDYESPNYSDTERTAYMQIYTILKEEAEKALYDQISVEKALENMKVKSDEAIKKAK